MRTMAAAVVARIRRTQEERSADTRARLLDATIDCLYERGYTGTTTTEVPSFTRSVTAAANARVMSDSSHDTE